MPPVPLTSPHKNAVACDGGLQPSRACRIAHGPHDSYFENLAGKSIASVRRGLATVFSISSGAEAFIDGLAVDGQYRLRAGDSVEFLRRRGLKAVGDLFTAEQLMLRWQIDNDKYRQLLKAGLPTIRFEDGSVRHPEVAVDEWMLGWAEPRSKRLTRVGDQDVAEGLPAAKKWCSIEDAALLSGRSVTTIRRDIRAGTLRAHVVGRGRRRPSYRIRRADLKAYIRAGLAETPDPPVVPTTTIKKKSRHFD